MQWLFEEYNPHHLSMELMRAYHGIDDSDCLECPIAWKLTDHTMPPCEVAEYYVEETAFDELSDYPTPTEPGEHVALDAVFLLLGHGVWLYGVYVIEGGP